MEGRRMFGVDYGSLGCFLQVILLIVGGLFFVCVLFYKIFQELLEEGSYLG
jgi:preprotein translocase subunit SecG